MRVSDIRSGLRSIPDALIDFPPEQQDRSGDERAAIFRIHSPDGQQDAADLIVPDSELGDEYSNDEFEPVFEWGADSDEMLDKLGSTADERLKRAAEVHGIDALGYYVSFHVTGMQWGAYVKLSGIAWLAQRYFAQLPTDPYTKFRLAFHAILQHELFHFATDVAVAQGELSQQQAWWKPATAERVHRGLPYLHSEECLANVWMLRSFRTALPDLRVRGKQTALRQFVSKQPVGYSDALGFRADKWRHSLNGLICTYADLAGHAHDNYLLWEGGYDWASQFPIWPRIQWRDCAIHLVDDSARFAIPSGWLRPLMALSHIEESDRFRKQLRAMGNQVQQRWESAKARAEARLTGGHDFKQWPKGGVDVWSMRVDRSIRAHLQGTQDRNRWIALEIGDHKTMGHG